MKILNDLEFRGLLHQTTDREGLEKKLDTERVVLYAALILRRIACILEVCCRS